MNKINLLTSGCAYISPRIREVIVIGRRNLCQSVSILHLIDIKDNGDDVIPEYEDIFDNLN